MCSALSRRGTSGHMCCLPTQRVLSLTYTPQMGRWHISWSVKGPVGLLCQGIGTRRFIWPPRSDKRTNNKAFFPEPAGEGEGIGWPI